MTIKFTIFGEPASKANSRQLVTIKGRPAFIKSKKALDFIKQFINHDKIYKQALHKKIMMFYEALGWGEPTDATKTIERFF